MFFLPLQESTRTLRYLSFSLEIRSSFLTPVYISLGTRLGIALVDSFLCVSCVICLLLDLIYRFLKTFLAFSVQLFNFNQLSCMSLWDVLKLISLLATPQSTEIDVFHFVERCEKKKIIYLALAWRYWYCSFSIFHFVLKRTQGNLNG